MSETRFRIGVGIGGTFTDLIAVSEDGGALALVKVPSVPRAPADGVLVALGRLFADRPARTISSTRPRSAGALATNRAFAHAPRRDGTLRIEFSAITLGQLTPWITDTARGTGNGDESSFSH